MTPAELTLVRRDDLRPPFAELALDVVLRNPEPRPRWFLLPAAIGPPAQEIGSAGVTGAEIVSWSGIDVAKFSGNGAFAALRVPADGTVTLRAWPITLWDEPPVTEAEVEVVTAADIRIGGQPVSERLDAGGWISTDLVALDVELADARRERLRVPAAARFETRD